MKIALLIILLGTLVLLSYLGSKERPQQPAQTA
jgi:hypothetical protein